MRLMLMDKGRYCLLVRMRVKGKGGGTFQEQAQFFTTLVNVEQSDIIQRRQSFLHIPAYGGQQAKRWKSYLGLITE